MPQTKCGFSSGNGILGHQALIDNGPTLYVDIGFDPTYKPGGTPDLAARQLWALVDTGATESCIDSSVAQQLALPVVDRRPVSPAIASTIADKHPDASSLLLIR